MTGFYVKRNTELKWVKNRIWEYLGAICLLLLFSTLVCNQENTDQIKAAFLLVLRGVCFLVYY